MEDYAKDNCQNYLDCRKYKNNIDNSNPVVIY